MSTRRAHGRRPGLSTDDKVRIAELERENRELPRANVGITVDN